MAVTNPSLRGAVLAIVVVAAGVMSYAAARHGMAEHLAASENPDQWLRAAQMEPSNAENWYRLGRYRQLDFEHSDVPLAITYYQRLEQKQQRVGGNMQIEIHETVNQQGAAGRECSNVQSKVHVLPPIRQPRPG